MTMRPFANLSVSVVSCFACFAVGLSGAAAEQPVHDPFSEWTLQTYRQPSRESQLLYHILVAELADRRGQPEVALEHYQLATAVSNDVQLIARATKLALEVGNHTVALEQARRWHELEPSEAAQQALALALLHNQRVEDAMELLDTLRKAAQEDGQDGFSSLITLFNQLNDKTTLVKVMDAFSERYPTSQFALYYYAVTAWNNKQHNLALAVMEKLLAQQPQWGAAFLLRARIRLDHNQADQAFAELDEVLTKHPQETALRRQYGRLLMGAKRLEQASAQFRILVEQDPKDAESLYTLGLIASEQKQWEAAIEYFSRVLQLGAYTTEVYLELGKLEEQRQNYLKARDWYARVTHPDRVLAAQMRIGAVLRLEGDLPAMQAHFATLRTEHPQQAVTLYLAEAEQLREMKNYPQAIELLTEALEKYPHDEELLYTRALTAEKLNRLDMLEQDLQQIIAMNPKNGHALNALGYTLADRTDRYTEAMNYIERAIKLLPDEAAVIDSLGWVHYRLGNLEEALKHLRRAYALFPDPEVASHLVEVLWKQGEFEEARTIWQEMHEKHPDDPHLMRIKQQLPW